MKKLLIGFALICFVAFGTLGIQSAVALVDNMEIVKLQLDDDPDKNKKAEAKTDGKTKCEKSCDKKKCCDSKAKCETKSKECKTKCNDKKAPVKKDDDNK